MVVGFIHRQGKAVRRFKGLSRHSRAHFIYVGRARFLYRLRPHVQTDIGRFHRIVGDDRACVRQVMRFGIGAIIGDEFCVGGIIYRLEVVPGRQLAHQRFGIDAAQFFFTHGEGDDRNIGGFNALVRQLFIEGHV